MNSSHTDHADLPRHPFWDFSLAMYRHASVKETTLTLQYQFDLNVNVVLFCCWLAITGRGRLSREELQKTLTAIHKWHLNITQALRQIRNHLSGIEEAKLPIKKLRHAILDNELHAEHIEQLLLASVINRAPHEHLPDLKKLQDAIESLKVYTHIMNIKLTDADQIIMQQLLTSVFPTIPKNEILQQCRLFSL